MHRDAKFGYGFVFLGLGAGYLLSLLVGAWGWAAAIVVLVIGACFLVSGHLHSDQEPVQAVDFKAWFRVFIPSLELGLALAGIFSVCWMIFSVGALKIPRICPPKVPDFALEKSKPHAPAPIERVKPPLPNSAQPFIQVAPSYGNLKPRTLELSRQLAEFVQHRYDQYQNAVIYPKPITRENHLKWLWSTDVEYRQYYADNVVSLRDEFSVLHLKDVQLENILQRDREE